jgi:hypothetical protein
MGYALYPGVHGLVLDHHGITGIPLGFFPVLLFVVDVFESNILTSIVFVGMAMLQCCV